MHCRPHVSMTYGAHDGREISCARQNACSIVVPRTVQHQFGNAASFRACRHKLQIDFRCPDADRLEGNTQPSGLVPQRFFRVSRTRRLIGTSLRPSGVLLSGTKIVRLFQSKFSMRIRKSSRSFLIPVSRIKATISQKSSLVRGRQLHRIAASTNFSSASASSLTSRPCSFIRLIFGARAISLHSSALRSRCLRVRSAQLALPAEPGNFNFSASSVVISTKRMAKIGVVFNSWQPCR